MLVLVVDTSTPAVQAGLGRLLMPPADRPGGAVGVELVAHRGAVDGPVDTRAHGELLAPAIATMLADTAARPRDLAAIVAGTGPGPFTGLRVGLVTAAVMAQSLGIPAYGVCSLDGLGAATTGHILIATDARRHEVYWARYVDGVRQEGPAVDRPEEAGRRARLAGAERAAGAGAWRYRDELALAVLERPRYPDLVVLARLASERIRAGAPAEGLTPLYLRRPDALVPGRPKPALSGARP